tara:strand:- start:54016 stop:54273 length:258 start_codon:yes stop_codon:yes gene_type:complete
MLKEDHFKNARRSQFANGTFIAYTLSDGEKNRLPVNYFNMKLQSGKNVSQNREDPAQFFGMAASEWESLWPFGPSIRETEKCNAL